MARATAQQRIGRAPRFTASNPTTAKTRKEDGQRAIGR